MRVFRLMVSQYHIELRNEHNIYFSVRQTCALRNVLESNTNPAAYHKQILKLASQMPRTQVYLAEGK
jgi:hypothetical protein